MLVLQEKVSARIGPGTNFVEDPLLKNNSNLETCILNFFIYILFIFSETIEIDIPCEWSAIQFFFYLKTKRK